jgi:hypothetical protein
VLGCFVVEVYYGQVSADLPADNTDPAGLLVIEPAG